MELTKDKCKHDRYSWSKLLNEGICLDCMMRLTQYPSTPSKEVSVEQTATAEVPWELKIIKQIWRRAYLDSEEDHVKILKEYGEFYAQSERQRAILEAIAFIKDWYENERALEGKDFYTELEKLKR